ncbi:MAG: helix-turn-helix domain-containing GNAT family N-acetyltransferase [Bdellovibrionota bacterium]
MSNYTSLQPEALSPEVRKYSRAVVREFGFFKSEYEDTGATYGETHALIELRRLGDLEVGELGRILNIDKTGSSKLCASLQRKGWIRFAGAGDKRKKVVRLTAAGLKVTMHVEKLADEKIRGALHELKADEREQVLNGMRFLASALKSSRARKEFRLSPCTPADDKQIASIVKRSLKDLGFAGPGTAAADPSVNHLSTFNQHRQCYLVAKRDGKVVGGVGIIGMKGEPDSVCELVRMFLSPEVRSTGLGQLLIETALMRAREYGYKVCYLETTTRMKAAQSLYERNGFVHVKKRRGNTGHFACTVLMECRL